ncbi:MAG: amino acid/amide transporter rane protein 2, family [Acidimicrobiaceae bacterium]|nr:amino acid/amide transporter rane protein 2, family [Acidimicrobiaceae bacterium]
MSATLPATPPGTQPTAGGQSVANDRKTQFLRLWHNDEARRLFACLVGGVVLALMTGPEGDGISMTSGLSGALLHPRIFAFLGIGAVVWALMTLRRRYGASIRRLNDRVTGAPRRLLPDRRVRAVVLLAILAVAIVYPIYLNSFWQSVLVEQIGVYVLLAIGLNVVVGYAGLLDLGYIAFFAIGAYSDAYWTGALPVHPIFHLNPFWAIPFAIAAAMLAGVLLGTPALRLRGDYLAILTLGFGEIIQIVANNLTGVTGGAQGVINIPHFSIHLFGINYAWGIASLPYYYLLLGFVVIALVAFSFLEHSRVGRAWSAIREDEVAAEASGVSVLKYKVMAFAIGASTSGFAGMIVASQISFVEPGDFTVQLSILILVLVIFGGMGSLAGAVVGAAVLQWLPQYLRVHPLFGFQQQDLYIYLGAILVLMMIFRPVGLIPSKRRKREIGLAEHGVGTADAMSGSSDPVV